MDRYVVLGDAVAHGRLPFIHARYAASTGQAMACGQLEGAPDELEGAARAFAEGGGRGCEVGARFRFEAVRLPVRPSERAELAQTASVLRFDGPESGAWQADQTEGVGLVRDLERNAGVSLRHRRVLLIGAGGAGAGVLGPLLAARPAQLVLANRTVGKASALVHRHLRWALRHGVALSASTLAAPGLGFDVVVNATRSSPHEAPSPVPAHVLAPGTLAVDLRCGPAAEPFLAWARAHGARARDGLGRLVEQAAESFWFWRGVHPETAPVLAELRRCGEAAT